MPKRGGHRTRAALAGVCVLFSAAEARALDAFEIQVYDGTADSPGAAGIELHLNTVVSGLRTAAPPELPQNHQTHLTAEPSLGITPWLELGAYVETAILPDGSFDYAGVKLRAKLIRPAPGPWRLGVNFELSKVPSRFDRERWGAEIRPIVAYTTPGARLAFAFNPIFDLSLTGAAARQAPSFEPAASAYVVGRALSAGLEYYGDLGSPSHPEALGQQQHYLFEVVNVLAWKRFELNAGVGEGLTAASNDFVAKVILGVQQ